MLAKLIHSPRRKDKKRKKVDKPSKFKTITLQDLENLRVEHPLRTEEGFEFYLEVVIRDGYGYLEPKYIQGALPEGEGINKDAINILETELELTSKNVKIDNSPLAKWKRSSRKEGLKFDNIDLNKRPRRTLEQLSNEPDEIFRNQIVWTALQLHLKGSATPYLEGDTFKNHQDEHWMIRSVLGLTRPSERIKGRAKILNSEDEDLEFLRSNGFETEQISEIIRDLKTIYLQNMDEEDYEVEKPQFSFFKRGSVQALGSRELIRSLEALIGCLCFCTELALKKLIVWDKLLEDHMKRSLLSRSRIKHYLENIIEHSSLFANIKSPTPDGVATT